MSDETPHTWAPVDLLEVGDAEPEPPTIGGLLYPGRRHLLSAEPEGLKSWLALVLCVEQIRADRAAVYVDFEMGPRETLSRLRALGVPDIDIAERFAYLAPDERLEDPATVSDLDEMLAQLDPSIVVIDSMIGALHLHSLDPNSGVDIEAFWRGIDARLRAHGAASLILDHLAKDRDSRGRWAIGSERKVGGSDVHLGLEAVTPFGRGRQGLARIVTHKDRPGYLPRPRAAELAMMSDAETGRVTYEIRPASSTAPATVSGFRPTFLMQRVSEYVGAQEEPPSKNGTRQAVSGKTEAVRTAIDVLIAEGYIEQKDGPRGAKLLHHVRYYRAAEDPTSPDFDPPRPDFAPEQVETTSTTSPHPYKGGEVGEVEVGGDKRP